MKNLVARKIYILEKDSLISSNNFAFKGAPLSHLSLTTPLVSKYLWHQAIK